MKIKKLVTIATLIVFTLSACANKSEPSNYFVEGNNYLENYQYALALEQFKSAINDKPSNPEAYLAAADILILKGELQEAKDLLILASEQADPLAEIYERLGNIYLEENNFEEALKHFNSGLDISSDYENLVKAKINTLSVLNLLEERTAYVNSLNNNNLSQELLLVKGIIIYEDSEQALEVLDDAKKGDNTQVVDSANSAIESINKIVADEDVLFHTANLAFELINNDYYEAALPLANKVIADNEYYETGYLYKGIVHLRINQLDEAISNLEKSLALNSSSLDTRIFLIEAYLKKGKTESVESNVNGVTPLFVEGTEKQFLELATILFDYDQFSLVKKLVEPKLSAESGSLLNILWLKTLVELGEYDKALTIESRLLETFDSLSSRQKAEVDSYVGFAKFKTDLKAEGLEQIKQAQLTDRTYAVAFYFEGVILFEQGDLVAAKEAIERSVDLDINGNQAALDLLEQL